MTAFSRYVRDTEIPCFVFSAGVFAEKPIHEAQEGHETNFLILSPEVLFHEIGESDALTLEQFDASIPIVLSCVVYLLHPSFLVHSFLRWMGDRHAATVH